MSACRRASVHATSQTREVCVCVPCEGLRLNFSLRTMTQREKRNGLPHALSNIWERLSSGVWF